MPIPCVTPRFVSVAAIAVVALVACSPGDVLSVPPPIGIVTSANSRTQAEAELAGATAQLEVALVGWSDAGVFEFDNLLTDELTYAQFNESGLDLKLVAADARNGTLATSPALGPAPIALTGLIGVRSSLLTAVAALQKYEPTSGRSNIGRAYALTGYTEVALAESFCAGVPLSVTLPAGGAEYGTPTTTDSLFATAEAHFDSALKYAAGDDTTMSLAAVGLGRARLGRGNFSGAAQATNGVPIGFVYSVVNAASNAVTTNNFNFYSWLTFTGACAPFNVGNGEGGNGLNFVTAADPRLALSTTTVAKTCDGGTFYYPVKFGNPSMAYPIATGVEGQLIAAEAALHSGDVATWAADLNELRLNAPNTYLKLTAAMDTLIADSTTGASASMQVDVMFSERAFWLYGLGTRLGDLRRLIRQYGRNAESVFPTGTYVGGEGTKLPQPIPNYGTDVSLMMPTVTSGWTSNPNYQGCTSPPSTA